MMFFRRCNQIISYKFRSSIDTANEIIRFKAVGRAMVMVTFFGLYPRKTQGSIRGDQPLVDFQASENIDSSAEDA